jgi:hypothetical protein
MSSLVPQPVARSDESESLAAEAGGAARKAERRVRTAIRTRERIRGGEKAVVFRRASFRSLPCELSSSYPYPSADEPVGLSTHFFGCHGG